MSAPVAAFADRIERIPPLPRIVHQLQEVTDAAGPSAEAVAAVLSRDPAIAARVLRVANSAFYGARRNVTTLSRAVVVLGTVVVRNMVLGMSAWNVLASLGKNRLQHETLWKHSIAVATASELIARQSEHHPPEEAFVAGLLHDIGQLCLALLEPDRFQQMIDGESSHETLLAERRLFGTDHVEIGESVLARWQVPAPLCFVAGHHHDTVIDDSKPSSQLLAIVMLADSFAQLLGLGIDVGSDWLIQEALASKRLPMAACRKLALLDQFQDRVRIALDTMSHAQGASPSEAAPAGKAVWVSPDGSLCNDLSEALIRYAGYELTTTRPECLSDLSPQDIVLLTSDSISAAPSRQGHRQVVRLTEPAAGQPRRWRDPQTGICHIPRLFTVFDLRWTEGRSRHA